jgi:hypothetical protein
MLQTVTTAEKIAVDQPNPALLYGDRGCRDASS